MQFDFTFFLQVIPRILRFLGITLGLASATFLISLLIALGMAFLQMRGNSLVKSLLGVWTSFFRGTPLVAQFFFIYFGLAQVLPFLVKVPAFWSAVLIMSLHYSAYIAVTIHSSIQALDRGQFEACISVGMSYWQSMFRIILPQAAVLATPLLFNSFLDIIKGTSLAFTIGLVEMMAEAQIEGAAYYRFLEAYTAVILLYWIMNTLFSVLKQMLEKRLAQAY